MVEERTEAGPYGELDLSLVDPRSAELMTSLRGSAQ